MQSYLVVSAFVPDQISRAKDSNATAIVLDLDASALGMSPEEQIAIALQTIDDFNSNTSLPPLYLSLDPFDIDLSETMFDALVAKQPGGFFLPRCTRPQKMVALDVKISASEALAGLRPRSTEIIAIAADTPQGIFSLGHYAGASDRLRALAWDAAALSEQLTSDRTPPRPFTSPYRLARDLCLFGSRSAGVKAIDTPYSKRDDFDGLRAEASAAFIDGFEGKIALSARQADIISSID